VVLLGAAQQLVGSLQAAAGVGLVRRIGTTMKEMRLPKSRSSAAARTDTGIIATSGSSGSSPRSRKNAAATTRRPRPGRR
jgi:hypothetical protein